MWPEARDYYDTYHAQESLHIGFMLMQTRVVIDNYIDDIIDL